MTRESDQKRFPGRVVARRFLSPALFELLVERPPGFGFLPGQRAGLSFQGLERDYTMITSPDQPELGFYVREVEGGGLSPLLARIEPGQELSLSGPRGYFVFRPSPRRTVFVATGTGLAPFISMARAGARGFILLHGVRDRGELHFQDLFRTAAGLYVPCLSRAGADEDLPPGTFPGRTTAYLQTRLEPGAYDFYLCGRREMIREVTLLIDERFPGSYVFFEIFS